MSNQHIIICRGLPASGKSTWAREHMVKHPNFVRINKDDLRAMSFVGKHSNAKERFTLALRDAAIDAALKSGYDVIVDDTNLNPIHIETIETRFRELAVIQAQDFTDVTLQECLERDRNRPNYVGERVIRQMYRQWLLPPRKGTQPYRMDLLDVILCDIDGTLALMENRNPYDEARAADDTVNEPVQGILHRYLNDGVKIIFVSGRQEKHRAITEQWLREKAFGTIEHPAWELLLRKTNDKRSDAEVKREIYEQHIQGKYNVLFILDDRDSVVDLWRSLELPCFQVYYGDF